MKLERVTLTGADDSVEPGDLLELSREFPFVEWGILVSRSHPKEPRWPSVEWIQALQRCARPPDEMSLSLHVCGRFVRDLLLGENEVPRELLQGFNRVQLNFHGERVAHNRALFLQALPSLGKRQIIFQIDGEDGPGHLDFVLKNDKEGGVDAVPLFDLSHGAGISPRAWPAPLMPGVLQGYAGGLGPDNVAAELERIAAAAADARVWIDMETKIRTPAGYRLDVFDLKKVRAVLKAAAPHVAAGCVPC